MIWRKTNKLHFPLELAKIEERFWSQRAGNLTQILNDYQKKKDRARLQRLSARAPAQPLDLNNMESVEAHVRLRENQMQQIAETHRRISQLREHIKLQLQLANNYASSLEYADLPDLLGRDAAREQEYLKTLRLTTEEVRTAADALKIAKHCENLYLVYTNSPFFCVACTDPLLGRRAMTEE